MNSLLFIVLYAVKAEEVWLLQKFITIEHDDDSTRHIELRWPCCLPYKDFVEEFR